MVERSLISIERTAGSRPSGCPWRAFDAPIVRDVLSAYPLFESGQLSLLIGDDPPRRLVQAITQYHSTIQMIHSQDRKAELKKRQREAKQKSPKKGGKR